ncbi:EAL domain-containing protein [Peribacillus asahii]|uniref:EAL domain-containing protein n=1 Tax=Peribacillus asahii TaxID=228899 RepID=UPI00207A14A8|nr:EAL domain-containing protein [Peribacillus asahii]USK71435.1 EAL domain-containing protein [Peribacillus asahii]
MDKMCCSSCDLMFVFRESGYLFLHGMDDLESMYPEAIKANGELYLPYRSKEEVMEQVQTILSKLDRYDHIEGNLVQAICRPSIMYSLHQLLQNIKEHDMIQIIRQTEFISFFQPIVSLHSNEIIAFEALLRDPLARVSPGRLFEAAQATGLHYLLDMKARQTAIQSRMGVIPHGIKSFINFLPSTIYDPAFSVKSIIQHIERHHVRPEDIVFEVVETEEIVDIDHLKTIFSVYKQEGIKVALDDFGSGHSTLEVLVQLVPDYVKIDRAHIMNCDQDVTKQKGLIELVNISKELGIKSLAEGVERKEELEFCRAIGIELAQGYYLGKPEQTPKLIVSV